MSHKNSDPKLFGDTNDLANLLGVSASYLNKARLTGDGPPFYKFGRKVKYHIPSAMEWASSLVRRSTSDQGEAA